MASRRMFSFRIINSAKFLQLPIEAQNLYFHLGIRADDDGVAEAYPVTRLLGTTPDVLKILVARGFIELLNEELVVFITDWNEHNVIRPDRKVDSMYKPLLVEKNINIVAPKPRSDVVDNSRRLNGPSTDGIGKVRLGKDSLISASEARKENPQIEDDVTFEVDEDFAPARSLRSRKPAPSTPLVSWAEQRRGRKFTTPIKQRSAILKLKESLDDEDIKALWMETENDEYWKERGLDFTILLSIADKKLTMGNRKDAEKDFKYHMSIMGKMMYDRKPRDEILAYREKHITPLKEKYGFK